jgi:hypothetical protein
VFGGLVTIFGMFFFLYSLFFVLVLMCLFFSSHLETGGICSWLGWAWYQEGGGGSSSCMWFI